jgi:hypothetical protein
MEKQLKERRIIELVDKWKFLEKEITLKENWPWKGKKSYNKCKCRKKKPSSLSRY